MTLQSQVRYGAIVIYPTDLTQDYGSIIAIARADARRKEKSSVNKRDIKVKSVKFIPECNIYVAVYQLPYNEVTQVFPSLEAEKRSIH